MDPTVVEIQLQRQESYLETMFDGADEGVISEHEKSKWKRCVGEMSWSPRTFFWWHSRCTKVGLKEHLTLPIGGDKTDMYTWAETLLRCAGLCGTPVWLPSSHHAQKMGFLCCLAI